MTFLTNVALKEILYEKILNPGEDALVDGTLYPASGSFIDVSKYIRFGFKLYAGGLDSATTLQVQQATANNGTPKDITNATVTVGATGDDKGYGVECHRDALDEVNGYKYVTCKVTGPAGGNDYGCLVFWAIPDKQPVTLETGYSITLITPAQ